MNETRPVPKNALDARSLDALLSLDVDSFLTDAVEADFIFQDDASQTRFFAFKPSKKRVERASFVAACVVACAVVFFAPFYVFYFTRPVDVPSTDVQIAPKRENPSQFKFVSSDVPNDVSNGADFWTRGSRLCDSLTNKAFNSTCAFYQDASQELDACRLSLARIAVKYSSDAEPRPTKERSSYSNEEKSEKKVDFESNEEYTLIGVVVDATYGVLTPTSALSEKYESCGGLRLLAFDPVFRIAQRIYIQDKKEEARTGL